METETHTQRDKNFDIVGEESVFTLKPAYNFNRHHQIGVGVTYIERQLGGTEKLKESKNRDNLQEIYLRYRFTQLREKTEDLMDLRWQLRYYREQDQFFKERFGSHSNYQASMYFGKRITNGFHISRFTSYLRFKKYQLNEFAKGKSRDYELRARLTPAYRFKKQIDLRLSFTYNHIFQNNKTDDENIQLDLGLRKQFKKYATLFRINYPWIEKDQNGNLVENAQAGRDIQYALNIEFNII